MSTEVAQTAATGADEPGSDAIACSPAEGARRIGVSKPTMYGLLMSGKVRSVKVGSRRLVSIASLRAFIDGDGQA
jgi:excisionase family DNA binding protein